MAGSEYGWPLTLQKIVITASFSEVGFHIFVGNYSPYQTEGGAWCGDVLLI
jgi:hypothetical protein